MAAADARAAVRRDARMNEPVDHGWRMRDVDGHVRARDRAVRVRAYYRGGPEPRWDDLGARVTGVELAMAPLATAAAAVRMTVAFRAAVSDGGAGTSALAAADAALAEALPPLRALLGVTLADMARADEAAEEERRRVEAMAQVQRRRMEVERRRFLFAGRAERAAAVAAWEVSHRATEAWFRALGRLDDAAATPADWAPRTEHCATLLMQAAAASRRRATAAAAAAGAGGPAATTVAAAFAAVAAAAGIEECALAAQLLQCLPVAAAGAAPQLPPNVAELAPHIGEQLQRLSREAAALEEAATALRADRERRPHGDDRDRMARAQQRRLEMRAAARAAHDDAAAARAAAAAAAAAERAAAIAELQRFRDVLVHVHGRGPMQEQQELPLAAQAIAAAAAEPDAAAAFMRRRRAHAQGGRMQQAQPLAEVVRDAEQGAGDGAEPLSADTFSRATAALRDANAAALAALAATAAA